MKRKRRENEEGWMSKRRQDQEHSVSTRTWEAMAYEETFEVFLPLALGGTGTTFLIDSCCPYPLLLLPALPLGSLGR